ncbi:MAG TPA: AIM24 family protein, partial [Gemmataceae bacterium]|nr:AIM24 family protein [Gemmataceae bacterium]
MGDLRDYRCPWCGTLSALPAKACHCPACGTPVDIRLITDKAGWYQLPPLRDMARLQIGQSMCQVEGTYVPVADFNLAAGDRIYFRHHVLLWKDTKVQLTRLPLAGAWRRLFAGLPFIMAQAHGPGRLALSQDAPGELIAIPLNSGRSVEVREGAFLVATSQIECDWFTP